MPAFYITTSSGLSYGIPITYKQTPLPDLDAQNAKVADECYLETNMPIENPPPFKGYDGRCRPWYQAAVKSNNDAAVEISEPYEFDFASNPSEASSYVGITISHYFNLEDPSDPSKAKLEGVMA